MRVKYRGLFLFMGCFLLLEAGWQTVSGLRAHAQSFSIAVQAFKVKNYSKSLAIFLKLVESDPENSFYWFSIGNNYYLMENYDASLKAYTRAIREENPFRSQSLLYMSKAYRKLGRLEKAIDTLKELQKLEGPKSLMDSVDEETIILEDELLAEALKLYRERSYPEALARLRYFEIEGDVSESSLLRGLILLKSRRVGEARQEFEEILETSGDRGFREEARLLLRQIDEGRWSEDRKFQGFVSGRAGYNSNVFDTGKNETLTERPILQFEGGGSYRFYQRGLWTARSHLSLFMEEVISLPPDRFFDLSGRVQGIHRTSKWATKPHFGMSAQFLGRSLVLLSPDLGIGVKRNWFPWDFGGSYRFRRYFPVSEERNYLGGNSHTAQFEIGRRSRKTYVLVSYRFVFEDIGDLEILSGAARLPLAYFGHGPGIGITWTPVTKWESKTQLFYQRKFYRKVTVPTGEIREDNEYQIGQAVSYLVRPGLTASVSSRLIFNFSNLTTDSVVDRNYTKVVVLGGLTWQMRP